MWKIADAGGDEVFSAEPPSPVEVTPAVLVAGAAAGLNRAPGLSG
jgi:hypothetical protein